MSQWNRLAGDGFTIYLPGRFEPLGDAGQPTAPDLHGGQVRLIVVDTDNALVATNIMVMALPASPGMTPGKYVLGTADELKRSGYQVEDKSVYELSGRSVGRLIYENTSLFGQRVSGVEFAYVNGETLWVIMGAVPSRDLENWLPVLEVITGRFGVRPAGLDGPGISI